MKLDATIRQLRREIEHLEATLSILENLQHERRASESAAKAKAARQDSADEKKQPERPRP